MSHFGQSIHNNPYRIISFRGARQSSNEVYTNLFPLPLRYLQWLLQSSWSLVFGLNSLTHIAYNHMCSHISLQSIPPELLVQILIHLRTPKMNRIIRVMDLLQYSLTKAFNVRNTYPVLEPHYALLIFREFRTSTFSNQIYLQWLLQSSWSLVFGLNSLTHIAYNHMCSHISLQSIPPELLVQILIHLRTPKMNRIIRVMDLLQYSLTKAFNVRNTYPVLEPHYALLIFREFRTSTFSNQILNVQPHPFSIHTTNTSASNPDTSWYYQGEQNNSSHGPPLKQSHKGFQYQEHISCP